MAKFVRFTRAAFKDTVFINPELVRTITAEPGGSGAWIWLDKEDSVTVTDTPENTVRKLTDA